jgi:outer membrane murein-binding lipoprotein Lpp
MNIPLTEIIITLFAAAISGLLTAQFSARRSKKEKIERLAEKAHDKLLLEIKDLQIKLYQLEKDLNEWKDKYYEALQELIRVKAELEGTLLKLTHIEIHSNED